MDLDAGCYALIPFTSGCHLKPREEEGGEDEEGREGEERSKGRGDEREREGWKRVGRRGEEMGGSCM